MGNSPSSYYPTIVNDLSNGKISSLEKFLEQNGDLNQPYYNADSDYYVVYSHHGDYLIHVAAYYGNIEAVKSLIKHGADINQISHNKYQNTPLIRAVRNSQHAMVAYLLTVMDINPDICDADGLTAMQIATSKTDVEMITYLVNGGADINCKDDDGNTPLHNASKKGKREIVNHLLDHGADPTIVNNKGDTPLDIAVNYGTAKAIKEHLKKQKID